MAALQGDNRVQWNAVIAQSQEWDYEAEGLTAPAAALIAIAVTAATGGALSGLAGTLSGVTAAGASATAGQLAVQAALKAGLQTIVNRAAVGIINNKGDLGATLRELGSDDSLKSLAVAMISAGVTTHLDATVFKDVVAAGSKGAGFDPNLLGQQLARDVTYSAVRAGISTGIQGGDFGDQFTSNLRFAAASTIGKQFAEEIGEAYKKARGRDENGRWNDPTAAEYFNHKLAHAVLGCAIGSIADGNCAAGALSGAGGAIISEGYEALKYDEFTDKTNDMIAQAAAANGGELSEAQRAEIQATFKEWAKRGVDLSKLSGALLAAAAGGDANTGALTAGNAAENNILPAVIIIAKIGFAAYTAYEVAQAAKDAANLIDQYSRGELTEDQILQKAGQLGINVAIDATVGKAAKALGVMDAAYRLAIKAGDKLGAEKIAKQIREYEGGAHRDTSQPRNDKLDSHHCPAKKCYENAPISSADGPAIKMDPSDHRRTASYGNSAEAKAYRAEQERLLNAGKLEEAIQMDIDDIRRIENEIGEPGKYAKAIQEMREYARTLDPDVFKSQ